MKFELNYTMTNSLYFFDSYAVIEILRNNDNYKKYASSIVFLTKLNLFEVYYAILRQEGLHEADSFLLQHASFAVDYDETVIAEAAQLKLLYKSRNISMADAIGYIVAKKWNVRFLTGDQQFKDLENVEYMK